MRVLIIITLVCLSNLAYSQQELLIAKLAPLSLVDPSYPTLLVGAEIKPFRHWSAIIEYGIQTPSILFKWNEDLEDLRISKLRSELRFYIKDYKGLYFGVEYLNTQKSYTKFNSWYSNTNGTYSYTSSEVNIKSNGYCFKSGYNIALSKKLYLDLFCGLGDRWVKINHNSPNAVLTNSEFRAEWGSSIDLIESTERKIYATIGFKIAYTLLRKKSQNP